MKKYLSLLLCLTLFLMTGCGAGNPADTSKVTTGGDSETEGTKNYELTWYYDDRISAEDMGYQEKPVIENIEITSKSVSGADDPAVITYLNGTLYATAVGKATVSWGNETYTITVEPAPLSLFMMVGHSLGAGEQGSGSEAVVFPKGKGYGSYEGNGSRNLSYANMDLNFGLGYFAEKRPQDIDDICNGVTGEIGAIAYEWNVLTGEKAWVLDAARGGSRIDMWVPGEDLYAHAVDLYRRAAKIIAAELKAGHYTLSHLGLLEYNCANGEEWWDKQDYFDTFSRVREGFLKDLAYDFGDGNMRTIECIGVCPTWYVGTDFNPAGGNAYLFNNGKQVNLWMTATARFPEMFLASAKPQMWMTLEGIEQYFAENYPYYETAQGVQKNVPQTYQQLYADGVHYTQFAYNAAGIESAISLYDFLYGDPENGELKLCQQDSRLEARDTVSATPGKPIVIVPFSSPSIASRVTTETTGDLKYEFSVLSGTHGTLTFKVGDKVLRTITVQ